MMMMMVVGRQEVPPAFFYSVGVMLVVMLQLGLCTSFSPLP